MAEQYSIKNAAPDFFDEDQELLALIPLHKWLFISASVLIFVVLPLLFVWSSLGLIHPGSYGQDSGFLEVAKGDLL